MLYLLLGIILGIPIVAILLFTVRRIGPQRFITMLIAFIIVLAAWLMLVTSVGGA